MDIKGTPAGLVSGAVVRGAFAPLPPAPVPVLLRRWLLLRLALGVVCARRGVLLRRRPCWCVRCALCVRAAPPRSGVLGSSGAGRPVVRWSSAGAWRA